MNIYEAACAAKEGKRVQLVQCKDSSASWVDGVLRWEHTGLTVALYDDLLTGWQLIPEPPKLYEFSEALKMMEQGKWMRSIASDRVLAFRESSWKYRSYSTGLATAIDPIFTVYEIKGRWQEVTE